MLQHVRHDALQHCSLDGVLQRQMATITPISKASRASAEWCGQYATGDHWQHPALAPLARGCRWSRHGCCDLQDARVCSASQHVSIDTCSARTQCALNQVHIMLQYRHAVCGTVQLPPSVAEQWEDSLVRAQGHAAMQCRTFDKPMAMVALPSQPSRCDVPTSHAMLLSSRGRRPSARRPSKLMKSMLHGQASQNLLKHDKTARSLRSHNGVRSNPV